MSFIAFMILKLIVHIFGYNKIKYKDDGRDYVRPIEFISIHMTFSILHAWITYLAVFNFNASMSWVYFDKKYSIKQPNNMEGPFTVE